MTAIYGMVTRSGAGQIESLLTQMLAGSPGGAIHKNVMQAGDQAGLAVTYRASQDSLPIPVTAPFISRAAATQPVKVRAGARKDAPSPDPAAAEEALHANDALFTGINPYRPTNGAAPVGSGQAQQCGIARAGGRWLAFIGHVVEDEDYQARLRRMPAQTPVRFYDQLLALYNSLGISALEGLNGQYALAIWEERTQRMLLLNDRYGLQPLYYWRGPHEFVFSSQLKAFGVQPRFQRRLNPVALADLLATGQMLGEHSLYGGVQALPPGTRLLFEAGHLIKETYARLPFYVPGWAEPEMQEAIEALDLNMQAAINRRVQPNTRLLLTGGLDSRLLAGYLGESAAEHGPIKATTIGQPTSRDVQLARAVAQQAGLAYDFTPANPAYLRDLGARAMAVAEGGLAAYAAWIFQEEEHQRVSPAAALISGVGGEGLSGRHLLAELDAQDEQHALNWLFTQHWAYGQAAGLLRPQLRAALDESQAQVALALNNSPEEQLSSRYDDFHYWLMRRRPAGSLLNNSVAVHEPYFDNDLVDYCLRLPPELRQHGQVFQELLERRFSRLAALPGAKSQPRPSGLQRLGSRLRQALFFLRPYPAGDDTSAPILYNHWMRTTASAYITGLLKGGLLEDVCDMRAVQHLLNDHMTGRANAYRLLGALVTFAEWRKQFM